MRRDLKELFRPKTRIQFKQAQATLQNYEKQSPQTTRIEGLDNTVALILVEVISARGYDFADRYVATHRSVDEFRRRFEPTLRKGRAFRVSLKQGSEGSSQKPLPLKLAGTRLDELLVFGKLNTSGCVETRELEIESRGLSFRPLAIDQLKCKRSKWSGVPGYGLAADVHQAEQVPIRDSVFVHVWIPKLAVSYLQFLNSEPRCHGRDGWNFRRSLAIESSVFIDANGL